MERMKRCRGCGLPIRRDVYMDRGNKYWAFYINPDNSRHRCHKTPLDATPLPFDLPASTQIEVSNDTQQEG